MCVCNMKKTNLLGFLRTATETKKKWTDGCTSEATSYPPLHYKEIGELFNIQQSLASEGAHWWSLGELPITLHALG